MLEGDADAAALFARPPGGGEDALFPGGRPPTAVRAELFLYHFSDPGGTGSDGDDGNALDVTAW